ncbi:ankyrin repeat domain-containing protein, partial [Endozoicomonas sp. ONNA2]|uniref:ankyrin repeat domain-containing protein n=1 Tax=Endozoicomonas sp. ONNA2 TaxID=2828741 RepID=UPI00214942B5
GGRLVQASCPGSHVFHLECITQWLDSEQQAAKSLDQRECKQCRQPLRPLTPLVRSNVLDEKSPYCESLMGRTAIHLAALQGNTGAIQKLLAIAPSLTNEKDNINQTALHLAALHGHTGVILVLLEHDRSLAEEKNINDETALHLTARNGHTKAMQTLLTNVPSLANEKANLGRALHLMAEEGHAEAIRALLEIDQSLAKEKNNNGETALHLAARNGHTGAIRTLLEIAPFLAEEKDNDDDTALHAAARQGHTEAIETLLTIAPYLAKVKNSDGDTALHTAAFRGHTEAFQPLLTIDPSLAKEKNNDGETALHLTARQGDTTSVKALLDTAPITAIDKNKDGETATHAALAALGGAALENLPLSGPEPMDERKSPVVNGRFCISSAEVALIEAIRQQEQKAAAIVQKYHREFVQTVRNGDCFYDGMSRVRRHSSVMELRARSYLEGQKCLAGRGKLHFDKALTAVFSGQIAKLRQPNEYAEQIDLRLMAATENCRIVVCDLDEKVLSVVGSEGEVEEYPEKTLSEVMGQDPETELFVLDTQGQHYMAGRKRCTGNQQPGRNPSNAIKKLPGGRASENLPLSSLKPLDEGASPVVNGKFCSSSTLNDDTETVKAKVLLDSDRSRCLRDFHDAARTGNTRLIKKMLVVDRSLAKEKDNLGRTALHVAAYEDQTEAIMALLEIDRSLVKEKDNDGWTALHAAGYTGQTEAIHKFLEIDFLLAKEKDNLGRTALHVAALKGHKAAIRILLFFDPFLAKEKDQFGQTALNLASWKNHTACQELLIENGAC